MLEKIQLSKNLFNVVFQGVKQNYLIFYIFDGPVDCKMLSIFRLRSKEYKIVLFSMKGLRYHSFKKTQGYENIYRSIIYLKNDHIS